VEETDGQKSTKVSSSVLMFLTALCTMASNAGAHEHAVENWPGVAVRLYSQAHLPPGLLADGERAATLTSEISKL
jgi:hypothetical protein